MINSRRIIAKIFKDGTELLGIDQSLLSAEFTSFDRPNLTDTTNWGIYANRGSLSFVDRSKLFDDETINNAGYLGFIVKLYFKRYSDMALVGTFKVESAKRYDDTNTVEIELGSTLIDWQNNIRGSNIFYFQEKDALEILEKICEFYIARPYVKAGAYTALQRTKIYSTILEATSIWDSINRICEISMCRAYEKENGEAEISLGLSSGRTLVIEPKNILEIKDNGYERIENISIPVSKVRKMAARFHTEASYSIEHNDEDGSISVLGPDCSFSTYSKDGKKYIKIKSKINTNYKIDYYSNYYIQTCLYETSRNIAGNVSKGEYETEEYRSVTSYADAFSGIPIDADILLERFIGDTREILKEIKIKFMSPYLVEDGSESQNDIQNYQISDITNISSNDFIQIDTENNTGSVYREIIGTGGEIVTPIHTYIMNRVRERYGNGVECFEIECLFGNYANENGVTILGANNVSDRFQKGDFVIPYVIRNGKREPLRKTKQGTAKKFQVIGTSYSYQGLLRQTLRVQEIQS